MKGSGKILVIIGILLVALVLGGIGSYNSLVNQRETVNNTLSQIDTQLQRRNDLIPNLVATVQNYAQHEEEVFTAVADARAQLAGATTIEEQAEGDAALSGALSRLLAISENYPELKANTNFLNLQDELAGTENRIANSRRDYNQVAQSYNTKVKRFPTVIFANILGFDSVDYFQADEGATENPDVGELFGE
ncbi:LemA protein [Alkalibaculum bacchi]|uniref:LemA protein n=1 Tax=Alkalibaculum bacchi TaxID=645887 RepID=A0A366I332_9FIRM|nr:LemA family protein [Alkalibaculum bacchi]RBP62114.1 LemA protein [Alkalibaculum bacchi]